MKSNRNDFENSQKEISIAGNSNKDGGCTTNLKTEWSELILKEDSLRQLQQCRWRKTTIGLDILKKGTT